MNTEIESTTATRVPGIRPIVDIRESPEGVSVVAEMPGAQRETLTVTVEDEILSISAEKVSADFKGDATHREIRRGRYERSFRLSRDLSRDGVSAEYQNGLLNIFIPAAEHTKPRRIDVQIDD